MASYRVRSGAVLCGTAIGAGVETLAGGVSLMPRGKGLSLVWLRIDLDAPAAPWLKVFWSAAAGLCCTAVLAFVVVVTTPFTCAVPAGVTRAPPVRAAAICCAVGAATPRVISDWRTLDRKSVV